MLSSKNSCSIIITFLCLHITSHAFKLGVENIDDVFIQKIQNRSWKVGLITNQTGVNSKGIRTVDILLTKKIPVVAIFVPEHGLTGITAGTDVSDSIDQTTHIPIISLYAHGEGKKITADTLSAVDVLIFDIQDSGMRHYTYISTLLTALQAAAAYNKYFVVLDRPNPLGNIMEGPLVESDLISFISIAPIPLRHGMTVGELARYFNDTIVAKPAQLHVVPMRGYHRFSGIPGGLKQQLSPNIKTVHACYGYSFLGLLGEIKPFDIGIGSNEAFECILLPESFNVSRITWKKVQKLLLGYGIQSVYYERFNNSIKQKTSGLQLQIPDVGALHSFDLFLALVHFFLQEGVPLSFSATFDKAVGSKKVQQVINKHYNYDDFYTTIRNDLRSFYTKAEKFFIYKPFPKIC